MSEESKPLEGFKAAPQLSRNMDLTIRAIAAVLEKRQPVTGQSPILSLAEALSCVHTSAVKLPDVRPGALTLKQAAELKAELATIAIEAISACEIVDTLASSQTRALQMKGEDIADSTTG